jgi:uncharacterized membrane protein YGL010W
LIGRAAVFDTARGRLLTATHHLGLYTAFHRAPGNKRLHAVFVPLILLTGAVFLAYAGDRSAALLHAGTLVSVALCSLLARIDRLGALALLSWLLPLCALAGTAVRLVPSTWLLPLAAGIHALAWAATVCLGHQRLEPRLREEDSNLYFRRGYFTARDLGLPVALIDRLIQFNIAPLSLTHDGLVWLGLRADAERSIARERIAVLERLLRGEPPITPSR